MCGHCAHASRFPQVGDALKRFLQVTFGEPEALEDTERPLSPSRLSIHHAEDLLAPEPAEFLAPANKLGRSESNPARMKYLLATMVLLTGSALAIPAVGPPERRFHVTSTGDVLEWQPGLGITVVRHDRVKVRRGVSDGKSIVEVERTTRVKREPKVERPVIIERPRFREEEEMEIEQVAPE